MRDCLVFYRSNAGSSSKAIGPTSELIPEPTPDPNPEVVLEMLEGMRIVEEDEVIRGLEGGIGANSEEHYGQPENSITQRRKKPIQRESGYNPRVTFADEPGDRVYGESTLSREQKREEQRKEKKEKHQELKKHPFQQELDGIEE